jgi:hypothetical protein
MSQRHYKDWITAYLQWTQHTEAPEVYHLWVAISVLAGALQRRVYIDMNAFDWVPNFYIFLVGKAGLVTKSTSLRMGQSLLKKAGKKIRFGSSSGSWQAIAAEIAASAFQPIAGGHITSPISFFVGELGTFLDPNDRQMLDFFVDSWDAQRETFSRITKSGGKLEIPMGCVNIIAGTTPTWIKENFNATMIGGGFASRLIFVQASSKRKLVAYPGLEKFTQEFEDRKGKLIEDLVKIVNIEGPMKLTQEALDWGTKWYEDHYTKPRQLSGERFDGFYARKQTHLHKLAMILSISRSDDLIVDVNHLQVANDMLLKVERDLGLVIDNITSKEISAMHKREILSILRDGPADRDDLYSQLYQMMGGVDYDKAIADLLKAKQISVSAKKGKTMLTLKHEGKLALVEDNVVAMAGKK